MVSRGNQETMVFRVPRVPRGSRATPVMLAPKDLLAPRVLRALRATPVIRGPPALWDRRENPETSVFRVLRAIPAIQVHRARWA